MKEIFSEGRLFLMSLIDWVPLVCDFRILDWPKSSLGVNPNKFFGQPNTSTTLVIITYIVVAWLCYLVQGTHFSCLLGSIVMVQLIHDEWMQIFIFVYFIVIVQFFWKNHNVHYKILITFLLRMFRFRAFYHISQKCRLPCA